MSIPPLVANMYIQRVKKAMSNAVNKAEMILVNTNKSLSVSKYYCKMVRKKHEKRRKKEENIRKEEEIKITHSAPNIKTGSIISSLKNIKTDSTLSHNNKNMYIILIMLLIAGLGGGILFLVLPSTYAQEAFMENYDFMIDNNCKIIIGLLLVLCLFLFYRNI